MPIDRALPTNLDAERFVLGTILLDDSVYGTAASSLNPDDFSLEKHRRIFKRMGELQERREAINRVTLANELKRYGELESCDGLSYLVTLDDGLPRIPNIESYIRIVREKSALRRIIFTSQHMINQCMEGEEKPDEILATADQTLLELRGQAIVESRSPEQIIQEYPGGISQFLDPSQRSPGIQTGYLKFDEMTGGMRGGELIILAARPSVGKSSFARNIAQYVSIRNSQRVVIFSLEMSSESVLQAIACSHARIDSQKFRLGLLTRDERRALNIALGEVMESPLRIDDSPNLSVLDIRARLNKIQKLHGPVALVIIDYLQLLAAGKSSRNENRTQEVSGMTRGLKLLSKEIGTPILALSQLSRAVEQRKGDHRPMLSDLRESGSIEQDSDVVVFLFRPELYDRDREDLRGEAELILAKQRMGPVGTIKLVWLAQYTKFENRTDDYSVYEESRAI